MALMVPYFETLLHSPCYFFLFSSLLSLSLPSFLFYSSFPIGPPSVVGIPDESLFLVCYFKRKGMILLHCSCLSLWPVALCDKPSVTNVVTIYCLNSFLFLQSFCLIVFLYSHLQTFLSPFSVRSDCIGLVSFPGPLGGELVKLGLAWAIYKTIKSTYVLNEVFGS